MDSSLWIYNNCVSIFVIQSDISIEIPNNLISILIIKSFVSILINFHSITVLIIKYYISLFIFLNSIVILIISANAIWSQNYSITIFVISSNISPFIFFNFISIFVKFLKLPFLIFDQGKIIFRIIYLPLSIRIFANMITIRIKIFYSSIFIDNSLITLWTVSLNFTINNLNSKTMLVIPNLLSILNYHFKTILIIILYLTSLLVLFYLIFSFIIFFAILPEESVFVFSILGSIDLN